MGTECWGALTVRIALCPNKAESLGEPSQRVLGIASDSPHRADRKDVTPPPGALVWALGI